MVSAVRFHVQNILEDPTSFPHHQSVLQLWNAKWKASATAGTYPFAGGQADDFEPIFEELASLSNNSTAILSNPTAYAKAFLPAGDRLVESAKEKERKGNATDAQALYFRANAVFRIARFPVTRRDCKANWEAWTKGKEAYLSGTRYSSRPDQEVSIPFVHADASRGDLAESISAYIRIPISKRPAAGWPLMLFICGLDSYKTDQGATLDGHLDQGFATLCVEIPGTGDCPASRADPAAAERWLKSIMDWIAADGRTQHSLDSSRIIARGISTGSYYAILLAHTHVEELLAAVAQGSWSHYALSPEWLNMSDRGEYPFQIAEAFAYKLGYDSPVQAIADKVQEKFSLKTTGVLQRKCCDLLLANGWEDTVFPIEDTFVVASSGAAKSIRLVEGVGHMGRPEAESVINEWLVKTLGRSYV